MKKILNDLFRLSGWTIWVRFRWSVHSDIIFMWRLSWLQGREKLFKCLPVTLLFTLHRTGVTSWAAPAPSPAGPGRSPARTGAAGWGVTAASSAGTAGMRSSAVATTRSSLSVTPGPVWTPVWNVTGNLIVRTDLMNTRAVVSPRLSCQVQIYIMSFSTSS